MKRIIIFMLIGFVYAANLYAQSQCSIDSIKFFNAQKILNNRQMFEDYYTKLNALTGNNYSSKTSEELHNDIMNQYFANENAYIFDDFGEMGFGNIAETAKTYLNKLSRQRDINKLPHLTVSKNNKITGSKIFCYEGKIPVYQIVVTVTYSKDNAYRESKTLDFYWGKTSDTNTDFKIYAILKHGEKIPFKNIITDGTIEKPLKDTIIFVEPNLTLSLKEFNRFTNKLSISGDINGFQPQSSSFHLKSDERTIYKGIKYEDQSYLLDNIPLAPYTSYRLYTTAENKGKQISSNILGKFTTHASPARKIITIAVSALSLGYGIYSVSQANANYANYQNTGIPADAELYRKQTQMWDNRSYYSFGTFGVSLYFTTTSFCKKDPLFGKIFK